MGKIIKIGDVSIGLIGIEGALASLKKEAGMRDINMNDAGRMLLEAVKKRNYVPASAEDKYLSALSELWDREINGNASGDTQGSTVRILGPGCIRCIRLAEMVMEVLDRRGIAADIEHVKDLDEIWRYGVIQTPALVVGDKVLCSGRMPATAQLEMWLVELLPVNK